MHNQFSFRILRDDIEKRCKQSRAMHIMASMLIIFFGLRFIFQSDWTMLLGFTLPAFMVLLVSLFKAKQLRIVEYNRVFRILEIGFLAVAAERYFHEPNLWMGLFFTCVAFIIALIFWLEARIFTAQFIDFHEVNIFIPGALSDKKYGYATIENIIYRAPYLTIQFKNQDFRQIKVEPEFSHFDEDEFRQFCHSLLKLP